MAVQSCLMGGGLKSLANGFDFAFPFVPLLSAPAMSLFACCSFAFVVSVVCSLLLS